jgi:hypothetical protein
MLSGFFLKKKPSCTPLKKSICIPNVFRKCSNGVSSSSRAFLQYVCSVQRRAGWLLLPPWRRRSVARGPVFLRKKPLGSLSSAYSNGRTALGRAGKIFSYLIQFKSKLTLCVSHGKRHRQLDFLPGKNRNLHRFFISRAR